MQFASPHWLLIGLMVCISLHMLILSMDKQKKKKLSMFASHNLINSLTENVSLKKRRLKKIFLLGAVLCCFIALARPQYGHKWIDVKRKGIDILFAIDTSRSMLANDVSPNRLDRSKYGILDFVNQLEGDRVGLLPFAGSSYVMCPLTVDYSAFEQSLSSLNTDIIPEPGTNIAKAISSSLSLLQNDANHKLLIIITDGENLDGDIENAVTKAREAGMIIFTVGVGTAKGELIPFMVNGKQEFVKDEKGAFVISRLDEENLRRIAESTDGLYVPLGNRGQGLQTIYQQKLVLIPKEDLQERRHKVPIDRFSWPLGLALFLLVAEFITDSRKKTFPRFASPKAGLRSRLFFFFFCTSALILHTNPSAASPGEDAYFKEDYLSASEYYHNQLEKDPNNPKLLYNFGATAYKNNLYDEAIESFTQTLNSKDLLLQQKAYFNRGNAQFMKGMEIIQNKPQQAMELWENALESYDSALKLNSSNNQAKENHTLVKKKLEELKQQQEKEKEQKQEQQDNTSEQQESDSSDKNSDHDQKKEQSTTEEGKNSQHNTEMEEETSSQETHNSKQSTDTTEDQANLESLESEEDHEMVTEEEDLATQTEELSREEAMRLLDEIQNEEGTLNFIPKKRDSARRDNGRNW